MSLSIERINRIAKERTSVFEQQSGAYCYPTDRGLDEYEDALPNFNGHSFIHYLEQRLAQTDNFEILDVGCGEGRFLTDLKIIFPEIHTSGISAYDYRSKINNREQQELAKNIDYRTGDIQRLEMVFPGKKFDMIVSLKSFTYLADPLNALRQCYRALKQDGLLFVDYSGIELELDDAKKLLTLWNNSEINAELEPLGIIKKGIFDRENHYSLTLRKGKTSKLPFTSKAIAATY